MSASLEGIRVIDLTRVLAGPYATMLLADLGAEVIKIEIPKVGDEARGVGPFQNGVSLYFMSINRGKKSVTLNLKSESGKQLFLRLVKKCDLLVENFTPSTMKKLGLDYNLLKLENPRLLYASCSGFGQYGPYSDRGAYDMIIQGLGGIMSITGEPDRPPVRVGTSIGDLAAALFTVIGILAALHHRDISGEGQMIDVAMLDCQVALLENAIARYFATGEIPKPLGARHPSFTPFEVFETETEPVVLAIGNESLWTKFCNFVKRPELITDPRFKTNALRTENYHQLKPILQRVMRSKSMEAWIESMEKVGVPCGPVNTIDKVVEHPQVKARDMIIEVPYKNLGKVKMPSSPIKLSQTPNKVEKPAPELGEHTDEVLMGLLGLDKREIVDLRTKGVI
jgi:CoA:oxalate CoA-transferase